MANDLRRGLVAGGVLFFRTEGGTWRMHGLRPSEPVVHARTEVRILRCAQNDRGDAHRGIQTRCSAAELWEPGCESRCFAALSMTEGGASCRGWINMSARRGQNDGGGGEVVPRMVGSRNTTAGI